MTTNDFKTPKPLVAWMDEGDPDVVPVMMADAVSSAASYFGVPTREEGTSASFTSITESPVTPEMILQFSRETGVSFRWNLGFATPWNVVEFMDDVDLTEREENDPAGSIRRTTLIRTPRGEMSDVFLTPQVGPACWEEHLVKSEADLPAFACFIERAASVILSDPRAREKVTAKFRAEAAKWPPHVPLYAAVGLPTFALTCNLYMGPATAFYLLADHTSLLERLFSAQAEMNAVFIKCAADAGADFVSGAVNGLEIYSPAIYERYFVPQARALHETARAHGLKGWVHTCGHMRRLIEMNVYERMGVDVLESLSHPPLGDVADLKRSRAQLGRGIVTRGGVNVSLFYEDNLAAIRQRVRTVLEETRGYPHMIGDTNDSDPPYPRDNILAVVDEVRKSGRMLASQWEGDLERGES